MVECCEGDGVQDSGKDSALGARVVAGIFMQERGGGEVGVAAGGVAAEF